MKVQATKNFLVEIFGFNVSSNAEFLLVFQWSKISTLCVSQRKFSSCYEIHKKTIATQCSRIAANLPNG